MDVEFPITAWRYHLDLGVEGLDRTNLVDALEGEDLGLFEDLPREQAYAAIRDGWDPLESTCRHASLSIL